MWRAPSTSRGHLSCTSFDQISSFSVVIAPMRKRAAFFADALELGDPAQVDQVAGLCEAQLHHRQQTVSAGQQLGIVAELREQAERVGQRLRRVVVELAGNHLRSFEVMLDPRIWRQRGAAKQVRFAPVRRTLTPLGDGLRLRAIRGASRCAAASARTSSTVSRSTTKRVLAVSWTWTSSGWRSIRWRQARFVPLARICACATSSSTIGLPRLPVDDRHDDVARRPLLERTDQLGQVAGADHRLVGKDDEDRVERAVQRREADPHRALLPLAYAGLWARVTGSPAPAPRRLARRGR